MRRRRHRARALMLQSHRSATMRAVRDDGGDLEVKRIWEIFWRFLALGCVSFGGPAAHIGYFQREFVDKRGWIDESAYARLIALGQFLPGPASSQIGFALGLRRGGVGGGVAAFLGFTLPSFILMYALAIFQASGAGGIALAPVIHGLKLLAVVVVADATLTMYRKFCTDTVSAGIAMLVAVGILLMPRSATQLLLLAAAAAFGMLYRQSGESNTPRPGSGLRYAPLAVFVVLFAAAPAASSIAPGLDLFSRFYQAGSLVFGGGHVVLPLLQEALGDMISTDRFLTGYAAAQAVPGPMFTLSTYLGAELFTGQPLLGAVIATLAVFLPGFLLVLGLQGAWESLAARPGVAGAIWGINAAVVGLLLSALYTPVFTSAVLSPVDFALVVLGFFVLRGVGAPITLLVAGFAGAGAALHYVGF